MNVPAHLITKEYARELARHIDRNRATPSTSLAPDITVAVRLDTTNQAPLDYYLLPRLDFGQPRLSLSDRNPIELESYRFDTLDHLYGMAERTRLRRVA